MALFHGERREPLAPDLVTPNAPAFELDAPVSNSGRLSELILQCSREYHVSVKTQIIPDVDRVLEQSEGVVSGDAIILNRCKSWLNMMPAIVERIDSVWEIRL